MQQNKQTNDHFSAKKKSSVSEPNFTKAEQKVCFGQFFWKWLLVELKKPLSREKVHLLRNMVKNAKWLSKSNLCSPFPHKMFPFFKGFKKTQKCKLIDTKFPLSKVTLPDITQEYYASVPKLSGARGQVSTWYTFYWMFYF